MHLSGPVNSDNFCTHWRRESPSNVPKEYYQYATCIGVILRERPVNMQSILFMTSLPLPDADMEHLRAQESNEYIQTRRSYISEHTLQMS